MHAMAPPDGPALRAHLRDALNVPYPVIVHDGLFYARAWNNYVDALAPGVTHMFQRETHPMALMLQANPRSFASQQEFEEMRAAGLRIFWMATAQYSHRREYAEILDQLNCEPSFRAMWTNLALGCEGDPDEPISFVYSLGGSGARFRISSRTLTFPPTYYLHEYHPDDAVASERLQALVIKGPPEVHIKRRLHWVRDLSPDC
jgi:hypothetical protein